jgi:hypothetical protein
MGRPQIIRIQDEEQLKKLAEMQCSDREISLFFDVPLSTLHRHHSELIDKHRDIGRISLRREMWISAIENKNYKMQIWLSKQLLGMKEPRTEIATETVNINPKDFFQLEVITCKLPKSNQSSSDPVPGQ